MATVTRIGMTGHRAGVVRRQPAADATPGWLRGRGAAAWGRAATVLALVVAAGCGGGASGPPLGRVSGVVTLDGQPLADATVTFTPANGRPSQGVTGSDGRYTLAYTAEQPGAMVGDHVVRISTEGYIERPGGAVEQMKERVPLRYNAQSTLTATVKAGTNDLPFELQSK